MPKWFGDWINDPANASKALDENGEPLVVYHGTPTGGFSIFDKERMGSSAGSVMGEGFYFTSDNELAGKFTNDWLGQKFDDASIYSLYINTRNPIRLNSDESARLLYRQYLTEFPHYLSAEQQAEELKHVDELDVAEILRGMSHNSPSRLSYILSKLGYDSAYTVTKTGALCYVVYEPAQIKSATDNNGEFDGRNPDITFSVRNLASMHTLSVDRLKQAAKLGGIPLPSVAVSRLDQPYSWGGGDAITPNFARSP